MRYFVSKSDLLFCGQQEISGITFVHVYLENGRDERTVYQTCRFTTWMFLPAKYCR